MKNPLKGWNLCEPCGEIEHPEFTAELKKKHWIGITVMKGKCPHCGKTATLIPHADFSVPRNSEDWD